MTEPTKIVSAEPTSEAVKEIMDLLQKHKEEANGYMHIPRPVALIGPDHLRITIEKLSPKPGDVLVLKPSFWDLDLLEFLRKLLQPLEETTLKGCTVIISPESWDFKILPEEVMNRHGWYRVKPDVEIPK